MVALICLVVFKDFIFLKKIYLFKDIGSDSLNATWPFMVHTANSITSGNFLNWSFSFGMGQNASSYSFYDPFDIFLYAIGKDHMIYFLGFKEIIKIFLS